MKTAKIPLFGKNGLNRYMLVDNEDVVKVSGIRWHVTWNGYAANRYKGTTIRAHRLIMQPPTGMDIDHINHDKIDNRKSNLRICTRSENLMNRHGVKGYYYNQKRKRWVVDCKAIGIAWKQFRTELEAKNFIESRRTHVS